MEPAKTNEVKKPIVVIKKGSLYKPNSPGLSIKRPITTASVNAPDAKKPCVPDSSPSVYCTYIINQVKAKANTPNATKPTDNTCYSTTFLKVEEVLLKESDQSNVPNQNNEIESENNDLDIPDPILEGKDESVIPDHIPEERDELVIPGPIPEEKDESVITYSIHESSTASNITTIDQNETQLTQKSVVSMKSKSSRCQTHEELPEYEADDLIRVGDTFNSLQEFEEYTNKNAQKWFFYYVRNDSRNLKTHTTYDSSLPQYAHYYCRFHKSKYKSQSKGIRKQRNELSGIKCPAVVTLKCPAGTDVFTVLSVCHHHGHELSAELFNKTPHGHRLPKEIKDEIRDLALFNVDPVIVQKYLDAKMPGLVQKKTLYNRFQKAKRKDSKNNMTPKRVEEMLARIKYIKANFKTGSRSSSRKPKKFSEQKVANIPKATTVEDIKANSRTGSRTSSKKQNKSSKQQVAIMPQASTQEVTDIEADFMTGNRSSKESDKSSKQHVVNIPPATATEEDTSLFMATIMPSALEQTQSVNELEISSSNTQVIVNPFEEPMKYDVVSENTIVVSEEEINNCIDITVQSEETVMNSNEATVVLGEPKPKEDTTKPPRKRQSTYQSHKVQLFPVETRCQKRHVKFPEHRSEGLVRVGDTFSSMEEFARHAAAHALQWFFYYQVHDSRNVKTTDRYNCNKKTWYNLTCRFNKGWYKSTSTGARKIKRKTIKCPAMVSMMCRPGEDRFKVTYVCHHHSHELSHEIFSQEAHGHRLAPELKDEIRELAWFHLDRRLMRQYLQKKTGFDLKQTIKNVLGKMRQERQTIHVSPEKEKEILDRIADIKKTFTIPKRAPRRKRSELINEDDYDDEFEYDEGSESEDEEKGSRLERRLNNILYDEDLIQSVKELQESTGCEIHIEWTSGEANPANNEGIHYLQAGLEEITYSNELQQPDDDNNDSQIEIDQELYTMDENIHDFVPTDHNEAFDVDNIAQSEEISYAEDIPQAENTEVEEISYEHNGAFDVDNIVPQCEEISYAEDIPLAEETEVGEISYAEEIPAEVTEVEDSTQPTTPDDVEYENIDNENDYNMMYQYTNYGDPNVEYESSEPANYINNQEPYECRDVGVQADFEIIELQSNCEYIQELESEMLKEDVARSNIGVTTRGHPKEITEEGIINRYNIEFYMNVGGIIPCMEQLAATMKLSVLDLLNKVYQSEAVFKMTAGRCAKNDRRTMRLAYVPLTIAFPYENLKYINGLQEYKNICSKYSDVVIQLENTIETISTELNDTKENLKNIECQREAFLKVMKHYEFLVKDHDLNQQSLKKSQEVLEEKENENKVLLIKNYEFSQQILKQNSDLADAHSENEVLLQKVKHLESQLQEDKIHKQPEPISEGQDLNISQNGNTIMCKKSKELEEKSHNGHIELIEKIKLLEQEVKESNANVKRYEKKIKDVEALYLTDSQSLLDKIASLENELSMFRIEFSNRNKSKTPSSTMLQFYESENKKLHNEIKKLKEKSSPEQETRKIVKLEKTITTLKKRLNVAKSKIKIGQLLADPISKSKS